MTTDEGIKQIENNPWMLDDSGTLNLFVSTKDDVRVHCYMSLRPTYCDRGHIQLCIDGPLNFDRFDSFPRYFFSFEEADKHVRTFLKWRLWKVRTVPHREIIKHWDRP